MIEILHEVTHSTWFMVLDALFHVVVVGHVIAHICRLGGRVHRWVNRHWAHGHP